MASASLVTVLSDSSFTDQVVDVAAFLSRSRPEAERAAYVESWSTKATEAESDQPKRDQITAALVDDVQSLGEGNDREIEGVHNLLAAMILAVSNAQEAQNLSTRHVSLITKDTAAAGREAVKYRILANVFNALPSTSPLRETVFLSMLDIAASNDEINLLSPALASLPQWLAQWQISESRKASALDSVASKLETSDAEKAYEFRKAHLQYISSNSAAIGSSSGSSQGTNLLKDSAEKALSSALKLSKVFEFGWFLNLSALDSLSSSTPAIVDLIKILSHGSLADWQKWSSSNGSELNRLGVDASQVDRKVRLLEMALLSSKAVEGVKAGSTQGAEVPYSSIAQAIQVPESEVESWVIDVIRAGLVSGKLSQVTQTFRVYRSTHRTFGTEQWKILQSRLQEWDSTLESIIATLSQSRTTGGAGNSSGAQPQGTTTTTTGIPGADSAATAALQSSA